MKNSAARQTVHREKHLLMKAKDVLLRALRQEKNPARRLAGCD